MKRLFITGNSSGLGLALTQHYISQAWQVFGCSRRGCPIEHEQLHDLQCDLSQLDSVQSRLDTLLNDVERLDLVILNAGVLGKIQELNQTPLSEIQAMMDINVWANKLIMDYLHQRQIPIGQIVMMSSGASVFGNKGWNAYSISKASLNMLAKLYAHEFPNTHISALAPGLIDTQLMDYLCGDEIDTDTFPALERIRHARGTEVMQTPAAAAINVAKAIELLPQQTSGSYLDMRELLGLAFAAK